MSKNQEILTIYLYFLHKYYNILLNNEYIIILYSEIIWILMFDVKSTIDIVFPVKIILIRINSIGIKFHKTTKLWFLIKNEKNWTRNSSFFYFFLNQIRFKIVFKSSNDVVSSFIKDRIEEIDSVILIFDFLFFFNTILIIFLIFIIKYLN